jgi:hypothetical protein
VHAATTAPDLAELHSAFGNAAVAMAASAGELPWLSPEGGLTTTEPVPRAPPRVPARTDADDASQWRATSVYATGAPTTESGGPSPEQGTAAQSALGVASEGAPDVADGAPGGAPTAATSALAKAAVLRPGGAERGAEEPASRTATEPATQLGAPVRAPSGGGGALAQAAAGDVDTALPALASVPPSQLAQGLTTARQAVGHGFDRMHDDLAASPPAIESPSGLPRAAEPLRLENREAPTVAAPPFVSATGGGQPRIDTKHQAARAPLPGNRVSTAIVDGVPEEQGDAVGRAAANAVARIPTSDESVDTTAGERPQVALTGEADPARMERQERQNRDAANQSWSSASSEMRADEGENAIYPTVPAERVSARIVPTKLATEGAVLRAPAIEPDVAAGFDRTAHGMWAEKVAKAQHNQQQAKEKKDTDERAEREKTATEITRLEQQTAGEQTAAQLNAKEEVTAAREGWNKDLATADSNYTAKAGSLRKDYQGKIDAKQRQADTEASTKLNAAEAEAQAKTVAAHAEAAEAKRAAERQSDGFFSWLKSKVKQFIADLKAAVNFIFDKLRQAVKFIIEQAKRAALWVIEQARQAIVGLIRAFGELLMLAADVFLAAFPEARQRAKALIRRAVSTAEAAVNRLAEDLKAGVSALLDALGAALDFVLALYQKAYNLILDAVEFIAVGLIEIMEKIGHLVNAARLMPDHFWGQFQEELLGFDLSEPLPFEHSAPPTQATAADQAVESGAISQSDRAVATRTSLSPNDVAVDSVGEFSPDPELLRDHPLRDGESKEFGDSPDSARTVGAAQADAISAAGGGNASAIGTAASEGTSLPASEDESSATTAAPGATATSAAAPSAAGAEDTEKQLDDMIAATEPKGCVKEKEGTPAEGSAIPEQAKIGPLTKWQRSKFYFKQMKNGVVHWFECNWPWLLAAVIGALLGIIVANILTGGAIMAALPIVLELVSVVMAGATIVKVASYGGDFLSHGWAGEKVAAAKALARGLAIGAIELVSALVFNIGKVIAAVKSVLKTGLKATAKAAVSAAKLAVKTVITKTAANIVKLGKLAKSGALAFVKNAKLILKGVRGNIGKGVRSLKELAERLWSKVRFRKFKMERHGKHVQIWGFINPWVLLADGTVDWREVEGDYKVGDVAKLVGSTDEAIVIGKRGMKGVKGATRSQFVEDLKALSKTDRKAEFDRLRHLGDGERRAAIAKLSETAKNARELRTSMVDSGKKLAQGEHAHHLVPSTHPRASEAREILKEHGVPINSKWNGAALSEDIHAPLHTNKYIDEVTDALRGAKSKRAVIARLQSVENRIRSGKLLPK